MKLLQELLNEAVQPFNVVIQFNIKDGILPTSIDTSELTQMSEYLMGKCRVSWDYAKHDKGGVKAQWTVVPQDKSKLTNENVGKLKEMILKLLTRGGVASASSALKVSVGKKKHELENIEPKSGYEKVYKTLFGKTAPKVGQRIKAEVGSVTFLDIYFEVDNIISNNLVFGSYGISNPKRAHQSKDILFVKDVGVFTASNAPEEYKKYF